MKEELQSKLVEILASIQTATGKAADFAGDQLPDIAQSYIFIGRVYETYFFLGFLIFGVFSIFWTLKFGFLNKKALVCGRWTDFRMASAVFGTCSAFLFLFFASINLGSFLLVWMAPKVWLLKEVVGLIK